MEKIPVHLLTGFLGAGKTTFLNHFIQSLLPQRVLVIENEVGQTNVDSTLIIEGVEDVIELSAGCLCCSLSDGLLDILEMASEQRETYDRIVIETTGVADPSSIVQVFLTNPRVGRVFELEQVICLADAALLEEWLHDSEEALRQVVMADVLLINKTDLVSATDIARIRDVLKGINPNALTLTGSNGFFSVENIMNEGTVKPESIETKLDQITNYQNSVASNNKSSFQHPITTFTLTFDKPFNLKNLSLELYRILSLYRDQVYRVKGIMWVINYPNRVILQSVRSTFVATDGNTWSDADIKESKLVFIGRGLKKEIFKKRFDHYQVA